MCDEWIETDWHRLVTVYTGGLISSGASLFSHLLKQMTYIIQTTDEGQLQCLTTEFALPAGL
jgi:hypothetical protein